MAHGSNNDGTQRESTSLYRSTEGVDPRPNNVSNISLSQRKNNPNSSGSVKHSDFIVDHIVGITSSKEMIGGVVYLKRGETTTITMIFQGAAKGFLEESRFTPQNFTWVTSDNSKLTILETSSTSGTYTDGSHRAYKITLKNTWNECSDQVSNETISCTFKDDFNNNLDASHGYNRSFGMNIRVRGLGLENVASTVSNGNTSTAYAFENGLMNPRSGKNFSPDQYFANNHWQNRRAKNGRTLTSVQKRVDAEEVVIQSTLRDKSGWNQSPGFNTSDTITNVTYQWQKNVDGGWESVVNEYNEDYYFHNKEIGGDNHGSFEAWKLSYKERRLHVQGHPGSGSYRLHTSVTGDTDHPWTCTYISPPVQVNIHRAISSVSLNGAAYICSDTTPTHSPLIAQANYIGSDRITFELWEKRGINSEEKVQTQTEAAGVKSTTFYVPISSGDHYYMVKAKLTDAKTGTSAGGGECWSDTPILVSPEWRQPGTGVATKLIEWYDKTSVMRRIIQPPQAPLISIMSREGIHRNIVTFKISSPEMNLPPYHVFDDVEWKIDAVDVTGATSTPFPWQTADLSGLPYQTFTRTLPKGVTLYFYAKIILSGDMSPGVVAPGQTNTQCDGPLGEDTSFTINCAQTAFLAPDGVNVPQGYSGDRHVIVWEDRELPDESLAEDTNAIRPEGSHFRVNNRSRDPDNFSIQVSNSSNAMATNIRVKETGYSDRYVIASGTGGQTITFNDDNNVWELDLITSFGNKTPSGMNFPHRFYTRRINR